MSEQSKRMRGPRLPCPRCGSPATVIRTNGVTKTYREATFQCGPCGVRFITSLSLVRIIACPDVPDGTGLKLAEAKELEPYLTRPPACAA